MITDTVSDMGGVFIALGSNLGNPLAALQWARRALAKLGTFTGASSLYRTAPVGGPAAQPDYLNAVVKLEPFEHDPEQFLGVLLGLERAFGRERTEPWGPRTLDLDLLAWGARVQKTSTLTLPHPRMMTRVFVLEPLCELAPGWQHPISGISACEALASGAIDAYGVVKTQLAWA